MPIYPYIYPSEPMRPFNNLKNFSHLKNDSPISCMEYFGRHYRGYTEGWTYSDGVFPDEIRDVASKGVVSFTVIPAQFRLGYDYYDISVHLAYIWGHYPDIVKRIPSAIIRIGLFPISQITSEAVGSDLFSTLDTDIKEITGNYINIAAEYCVAVVFDMQAISVDSIFNLHSITDNFIGYKQVSLGHDSNFSSENAITLVSREYGIFCYTARPSYIPLGLMEANFFANGDLSIKYLANDDCDPVKDLGFAIPFKNNVIAFLFSPEHRRKLFLLFSKPPAIGPAKLSKMEEIWDSICLFFGASDKTYSSLPRSMEFYGIKDVPPLLLEVEEIRSMISNLAKEVLRGGDAPLIDGFDEHDHCQFKRVLLANEEPVLEREEERRKDEVDRQYQLLIREARELRTPSYQISSSSSRHINNAYQAEAVSAWADAMCAADPPCWECGWDNR